MGYFGKLEEKQLAIELRKKGFSYRQILKQVNVSKDTVSRWCREIILSPSQMEALLKRKLIGGEKGRLIAAKMRVEKRLREEKEFLELGINEIGKLTRRDRFITGIALYAGEGGKKKIEFANSDPRLIKFMMKWFREFCDIPENKFRGAMWIHDNLDWKQAKKFWSLLTNIPENQIYRPYIAKNKVDSKKIRKNIHNYGVFSVVISDIKKHRKLMGWISGILGRQLI